MSPTLKERAVGPIEAAMIAAASERRKRLYGLSPKPVVRHLPQPQPQPQAPLALLQWVPPQYPSAKRLATAKGRKLIMEVAAKHRLNWRELVGPVRSRGVVTARHEAAFRLVVELGFSYPKAGRMLGNRDHSTIIASCRRYAQMAPDVAEAWQAHVDCETADRVHKRERAIRLYVEDGLTPGQISVRVHSSPTAVSKWISELSKDETWLSPLSPNCTDSGDVLGH